MPAKNKKKKKRKLTKKEIEKVFEEHGDHISSETLTETLEKGERDWHFNTAMKLNEMEVALWMERV